MAKPALAQWSRPLAALICGVRPKSVSQTTSVDVEQAALFQVDQELRQALIDARHQAVFQALEVVLVRVPAAVGDGDEPHAGFDQPAGQQAALAELVLAVGLAELGVFLREVERALRFRRGDHVEGGLVVLVEGVERRRLHVAAALQLVDAGQHLLAEVDPLGGDAGGRRDVADDEIVRRWDRRRSRTGRAPGPGCPGCRRRTADRPRCRAARTAAGPILKPRWWLTTEPYVG